MLIALQALLGALIGVCFFEYNANVSLYLAEKTEITDYTPSFYEVAGDYYDSDIYTLNLKNSVSSILRYVAIREQLEDKGQYNPDKTIDICEYVNRFVGGEYSGPKVSYYVGDLIAWGQRMSSDSELFTSYEFFTVREYCDFFNLDYDEFVHQNDLYDYPEDSVYTSFEIVKNTYLTAENLNLEDYAENEIDYLDLCDTLKSAIRDLYSNYLEYLDFNDYFDESNSNLRYAVSMSVDGRRVLYTNDSALFKGAGRDEITKIFKEYGEYIYSCPASLEFTTSTPITYEVIKQYTIDSYYYAYPDDARIWIAVDATYPCEDIYSYNYYSFDNVGKLIPFVVSIGAAAFIGFIAVSVYAISKERSFYGISSNAETLKRIQKLSIEAYLIFFAAVGMILYFAEEYILSNFLTRLEYSDANLAMVLFIGIFVDIYVALLFIYLIIRRVICRNLFEGSIFNSLLLKLKKPTAHLRDSIEKLSESKNTAFKVWGSYIAFLLFNVFWALMLFFGSYHLLSFIVLFVFDAGAGVWLFNRALERQQILEGLRKINKGDYDYKIDCTKMKGANKALACDVNAIGYGLKDAIEKSTKDEKLKADLITNVSHDIKTPLTSIVSYVDLLKRENIENERVKKYIAVLDEKSARLKQLTFDLVEASKISSGNISVDLQKIDFVEFIKQATGEFVDRLEKAKLELVVNIPKTPVYIMADPRHIFRVFENLLNNICKYALTGTRVYLDVVLVDDVKKKMFLSLKNVSSQQLNIPANELTERFIRGDVSRSTEGSGLGLSIAKSLVLYQNGEFEIYLDGDLFKVTVSFDICE